MSLHTLFKVNMVKKKHATRQFHHLQRFKYPMDVWMFLHLSWRSTWQMRNLTTLLKLFNLAFDGHLMKPNGDTRGSMEKNTEHLLRLRKHYQNIPALKLHGSCIGRYRSGRSLYVPYLHYPVSYFHSVLAIYMLQSLHAANGAKQASSTFWWVV